MGFWQTLCLIDLNASRFVQNKPKTQFEELHTTFFNGNDLPCQHHFDFNLEKSVARARQQMIDFLLFNDVNSVLNFDCLTPSSVVKHVSTM